MPSHLPILNPETDSMVDTAKMRRPKFSRRLGGPGGRVEHDSRGNAAWVRTRKGDSTEPPDTSALALAEDMTGRLKDGREIHRKQNTDISALKSNRKTKRQ
jgi:hypothetical protein